MKRILFLFTLLLFTCFYAPAQSVIFRVNDGTNNSQLKNRIESNISLFLQACNLAFSNNVDLQIAEGTISEDASQSVSMLWHNMPFRCIETLVIERVLHTYAGYQVRNIPIEVYDAKKLPVYQELVIDMDENGIITRVNLAIQNHLYRRIFADGTEVSDLRHRQMILDYVEQFRTAYNRKDISFLEQVFSDDALIITGRVIQRKRGDHTAILKENTEIIYMEQSKREYLNRLRTYIFPSNSYIRVSFSDIKVSRHPSIQGYYGVTLRQGYESSIYSDDGYLFMIWDFRDEEHPQIHVRTWQPYWIDSNKTISIDEGKVFGINDFKIQ